MVEPRKRPARHNLISLQLMIRAIQTFVAKVRAVLTAVMVRDRLIRSADASKLPMLDRIESATDLIIRHEGLRLKPYRDTTGHLTIGYGRNLDERGVSINEATLLLHNDVAAVANKLGEYRWFRSCNIDRQAVLIDMAFNLGINGLLDFHHLLAAVDAGNYNEAADAMLASKWASQVGARAVEDARIMRGKQT